MEDFLIARPASPGAWRAKTTAFRMTQKISGDELHCEETTLLDIYGRHFEPTDGGAPRSRRPGGV